MLAGESRDQKGRNLRRVGERLVPVVGNRRRDCQHVRRLRDERVMLAAKMSSDGFGVGGFIVTRVGIADTECLDRSRGALLHEGSNRRGVDPTRQEGAERNVRPHAHLDGLAHPALELVDRVLFATMERSAQASSSGLLGRPELPGLCLHVRAAKRNDRAGRNFVHVLQDARVSGNDCIAEESRNRRAIQPGSKRRKRVECLELGRECDAEAALHIEQGLDAQAVPNECQSLAHRGPKAQKRTSHETAHSAPSRPSASIASSTTSVSEWPLHARYGGLAVPRRFEFPARCRPLRCS